MSRTFIVLLVIIMVPVTYVLGSAAIETWNDPGKTADLALDESLSVDEREKAVKLMQAFIQSCPMLLDRYIDKVQDLSLTYRYNTLYRSENYGWTDEAVLSMKISKDAPIAAGHTVRYFISETGNAGWVTDKLVGAELCGVEGDPMAHTFVPF